MTSRPLFIGAAILFGVGLILELLGIGRFEMGFLFAGLLCIAAGHAV